MLNSELQEQLLRWSANHPEVIGDYDHLIFLADFLFTDYEPAIANHYGSGLFEDRFLDWLDNVDTETSKLALLKLCTAVFYLGRDEMRTLYEAAYHENFMHWLVEDLDLKFNKPTYKERLERASLSTWFCPVTDSFRVNQFYHINSIQQPIELRPEWRSLAELGDIEKVRKHLTKNKYSRLVLLEDFVGTGTQVLTALQFAQEVVQGRIPILFIPLIICEKGLAKLTQAGLDGIVISPAVVLGKGAFISDLTGNGFADLAYCRNQLMKSAPKGQQNRMDRFNLDCLLVMYSNTPNNSAPELHVQLEKWKPLFPRINRS